jgi:hypothetical protein
MDDLSERLTDQLQQSFPSAEISFDPVYAPKLGGLLVWQGFDNLEQLARQHHLWSVLRAHLSPDEQLRITAILTMTPAEMAIMNEEE